LNTFKGISQVQLGVGDTVIFWSDLWNGRILQQSYLELFSFTTNKSITAQEVIESGGLESIFQLLLSEEAYEQLCELEVYLQFCQLASQYDSWTYIWENGHYSSQKAYKRLVGDLTMHPSFNWIWRSACQMKHKVFYWLLLQTRLNTRGLLRRKNMHLESYTYDLCLLQRVKKLRHLFFRCPFVKNCWLADRGIGSNVAKARQSNMSHKKKIESFICYGNYNSHVLEPGWSIWKEINSWIFKNENPSIEKCKINFKKDFAFVIHRAKSRHKDDMESWLSL
jgi:hypothetical protein